MTSEGSIERNEILHLAYKAYKISVSDNQEGWQSLVYCNGLENRRAFIGTVGSNPTPSATLRATL